MLARTIVATLCAAGLLPLYHHGGGSRRTLAPALRLMVVGPVEDTGQRLLTVEKMRVGNLHRLLARFLDFGDAKLNERLLFPLLVKQFGY